MLNPMFRHCFVFALVSFLAFVLLFCIYYFLAKDILKNVRRVMRAIRIRKFCKNKTRFENG